MRKTYISPKMKVVKQRARHSLLAGSLGSDSTPQNLKFTNGYYEEDTEGYDAD